MLNKIKFVLPILMMCLSLKTHTQAKIKDTLFVKYDKKYLMKKLILMKTATITILRIVAITVSFFLKEIRHLKFKLPSFDMYKKIDIRKLITRKEFYSGVNNTTIIDDWELWLYFREKTIFLIKDNEIIELEANHLIE